MTRPWEEQEFLLEDGTITFNPYDVGLERLGGRP